MAYGRTLSCLFLDSRLYWLSMALLLSTWGTDASGETARFDMAGLPAYVPARTGPTDHCHGAVCHGEWGVIRVHGTELTQALVARWQNNFLKMHPNIRYSNYFVPNGFAGITTGTHDINVIGHTAWRSDVMAFREVHGYEPLEIMFATGGFNRGKGNTPAPVFIVNIENPINGLTIEQLDGIFGAQRTGGWTRDYRWNTHAARGPEENIRFWGQLGLTGEWADKPIKLYGFDATLSNWSELIQRVIFKGGDKWNPALHEMVRGGNKAPADAQIVQSVANNKYAIGFNLMRVIETNPDVKPIGISPIPESDYVFPTEQTVYDRTYPLSNAVYLYINKQPGRPLSPRLHEFLTYILSREGQQDILEEGMYLPLTPQEALNQLEKLK